MANAIMEFLQLKGTDAFKADKDKFFNHPLDMIIDGVMAKGFIQDVSRTYTANQHVLEVVVLHKESSRIFIITKTCVAPPDCEINWDTVQCATNVEGGSAVA